MGAGASKAPPDITAKSLEAKRIAQDIFRFMVTQMKFEEYLSLANPDQCKKYVILIADSLQKFFTKVKIVPEKTKDGYIYFRKFDDVKGASPMSAQYCTVIALFYVRIFQIYGALALSILDADTNVYEMTHGGGLDELEALDSQSVQVGGTLPTIPEEPLRVGEALPGIYNALTPFLSRIRGDNTFYKFTGKYMLLSINSTIFNGQQQYGMQFMYERGATFGTSSKFGQIVCFMRMEPTEKGIKIILSGITIKEEKRKDIRLEETTIRVPRRETGLYGIGQYGNLADILNDRFLDILRQGTREREDDEEDTDEKRPGYPSYKAGEKKEDTKVKEQFRTLALIDRLKKMDSQPIKAHCIARALQLVSPKGLQKEFPQTIISNICDSKFFSTKDKRFSQSLPPMHEKILESKGIYTLWQLFFDKVLPDMSPDMSDATRAKYQVASAYLSKAFGNPAPLSMKEIPAKTGTAFCAGKQDKQVQVTSKEAIQALRSVVGKMIETQGLHTANVMKLLGKLFLIQPGKPIQLHPNVLEGGLPAVNAIGEQARALLVAYYTNCEGLYGTGIQVIERSKAKIIERYY